MVPSSAPDPGTTGVIRRGFGTAAITHTAGTATTGTDAAGTVMMDTDVAGMATMATGAGTDMGTWAALTVEVMPTVMAVVTGAATPAVDSMATHFMAADSTVQQAGFTVAAGFTAAAVSMVEVVSTAGVAVAFMAEAGSTEVVAMVAAVANLRSLN
jgi:hypothetical protein